ncbi:amino acid ABC transporter substrate-binding protein, PAAT family [Candidatus Vecturithrix granuli]|uniref:Amino acid ABC transporter substrate-binding protein, PAAT family n=1 Tax=Vecturithrix granuli TaxID=1499967 RepID=A0A081C3I9_VECG1|nr:amino acid ABC transporter substrate-binding protein, PAAT family [Candidatus Vecturithrix granuli]
MKYLKTGIILLMWIPVLIALSAYAQEGQVMQLVYFNDYAPFSWENEQKQMQGILIDVLTEALQNRMKISVSHTGYPWKRAQHLVQQGEADAFCTVPTEERRTYTEVSHEPVIVATFTVFVRTDHPKLEQISMIKTLADLKEYTLGHFLGAGWAQQNLEGMDVKWASDLEAVLYNLAKGRFDLHPGASQVVRFTIKQLGLKQQIAEIPTVLDSQPFSLCIGKLSPFVNILPKFDQTLQEMKADGTLQQIYEQYE